MAATRVRGLLAPAPAPQFWRVAPLWRRCRRALCSYAKLGLQRGASDDAVRQAFREAAQLHHPDKVGGDRARFEECKAAADAILDRTEGTSDEPPRWQRRSKPRTEDRDDESYWDHGFGSSERVYNDERDFDRPEDPEQRANDSARVHYIFKVLLGIIAACHLTSCGRRRWRCTFSGCMVSPASCAGISRWWGRGCTTAVQPTCPSFGY